MQLPLIKKVGLYSIKVENLEGVSLAQANGLDFDQITDNILFLRSGPIKAQVLKQTAWIWFPSIAKDQQAELVISLEIPDVTVFSQYTLLNLKKPDPSNLDQSVTYRVLLDSLLDDVYACYHSWPKEECKLRFYLNGMSVYEMDIRLENGN